jgi:hypothetical protein
VAPPKKVKKARRTRARVALGQGRDVQWALIGMGLITLAVIGILGHTVYQFYSGPPVRVLQNID